VCHCRFVPIAEQVGHDKYLILYTVLRGYRILLSILARFIGTSLGEINMNQIN